MPSAHFHLIGPQTSWLTTSTVISVGDVVVSITAMPPALRGHTVFIYILILLLQHMPLLLILPRTRSSHIQLPHKTNVAKFKQKISFPSSMSSKSSEDFDVFLAYIIWFVHICPHTQPLRARDIPWLFVCWYVTTHVCAQHRHECMCCRCEATPHAFCFRHYFSDPTCYSEPRPTIFHDYNRTRCFFCSMNILEIIARDVGM